MNFEQQYADNLQHATHPEPGDYWHEMFCPILVVLKVTDESVTYCEKRKNTDADHWTWDLSETKRVWREDFRKRLEYQSVQMKDKFWAWVAPRAHVEFSDHWTANRRAISSTYSAPKENEIADYRSNRNGVS